MTSTLVKIVKDEADDEYEAVNEVRKGTVAGGWCPTVLYRTRQVIIAENASK
jgi:hypothetical protein